MKAKISIELESGKDSGTDETEFNTFIKFLNVLRDSDGIFEIHVADFYV